MGYPYLEYSISEDDFRVLEHFSKSFQVITRSMAFSPIITLVFLEGCDSISFASFESETSFN